MTPEQAMAARVAQLRSERRMTQHQLAEKSGVAVAVIGRIEKAVSSPHVSTVAKIARVFGLTAAEMIDCSSPSLIESRIARDTAALRGNREMQEIFASIGTLLRRATEDRERESRFRQALKGDAA